MRKARPACRRILADLADGARDGLVAYHVDRLTRRPLELEQFLEVTTAAKLRHVRFVAGGDLDVANGDGSMVVRILAAVAARRRGPSGPPVADPGETDVALRAPVRSHPRRIARPYRKAGWGDTRVGSLLGVCQYESPYGLREAV